MPTKIEMLWPDDRIAEFDTLDTLMREIESLPNASNCIERLQRIVDLAAELSRTNYNADRFRPCFMQWLGRQRYKEVES